MKDKHSQTTKAIKRPFINNPTDVLYLVWTSGWLFGLAMAVSIILWGK